MSVDLPAGRFLRSPDNYVQEVEEHLTGDGASRSRRFGIGHLRIEVNVAPLTAKEFGVWKAFLLEHGASKSVVRVFPPNKCYPTAYKSFDGVNVAGGGAFGGAANLFNRIDDENVTVTQCPSLFELNSADWVGFEKDGRFSLHVILDSVTGDAGGSVNLRVFPAIPVRFVAGSIVHFYKPKGEFRIAKDSETVRWVGTKRTVSFLAIARAA